MPGGGTPARGRVLWFARHGETDWNARGMLQGSQDIPLNDTGRRQAAAIADRLRDLAVPVETLPFHVSPMDRTRETAAILRARLGLPPHEYRLDPRLAELSFGRWEGMTWKEVRASDSAAPKRVHRGWAFVPPGGESYAMLAERVRPWLETVEEEAIVVSHGGVARVLLALVCGLEGDAATIEDIWQGRLLRLAPEGFVWY